MSPLSGWEPTYDPKKWNSRREVKETHNCFAYAMNIHDPKQFTACFKSKTCNVPFHQPGSASGHPRFTSESIKSCSDMVARLLGDNPTMKLTNFTNKCPAHTSKISVVVDADQDYHFYRQDTNGMWSHKPGGTEVTNLDASGRPIYDPKLADRNYNAKGSSLNYNIFCSYFCVPRDRPLYLKIGGSRRRFLTRKQQRGGIA